LNNRSQTIKFERSVSKPIGLSVVGKRSIIMTILTWVFRGLTFSEEHINTGFKWMLEFQVPLVSDVAEILFNR